MYIYIYIIYQYKLENAEKKVKIQFLSYEIHKNWISSFVWAFVKIVSFRPYLQSNSSVMAIAVACSSVLEHSSSQDLVISFSRALQSFPVISDMPEWRQFLANVEFKSTMELLNKYRIAGKSCTKHEWAYFTNLFLHICTEHSVFMIKGMSLQWVLYGNPNSSRMLFL